MVVRVLQGHVIDVLATLEPESCHLSVCSPPYWLLRSYQTPPQIWPNPDGTPLCRGGVDLRTGAAIDGHEWDEQRIRWDNRYAAALSQGLQKRGLGGSVNPNRSRQVATCTRCGAWRGELGSEPTVERYVADLVFVFRAVHRVLRKDGTCWVNLASSYFNNPGGQNGGAGNTLDKQGPARISAKVMEANRQAGRQDRTGGAPHGYWLKPLDYVDVPGLFAQAMVRDGWWWRADIALIKRSPLPESVSGWKWEKCRVKTAKGEPANVTKQGEYPNRTVAGFNERYFDGVGVVEWADCPGCSKCRANDGLVLRRGNGRPTRAWERLLVFAKQPGAYWDTIGANEFGRDMEITLNGGSVLQEMPEVWSGTIDPHVLLYKDQWSPHELVQGVHPQATQATVHACGSAGNDTSTTSGIQPITARESISQSQLDLGELSGISAPLHVTGIRTAAPTRLGSQETSQTRPQRETPSVEADGERASIRETVSGEASGATTGPTKHGGETNSSRVADNSGNTSSRLPLLRPDGSSFNTGSCDPVEEGRPTRQGERSAGVSVLQQQEGRPPPSRNLRDWIYWSTQGGGLREQHYASYPQGIPSLAIRAGTSEGGVCAACGAPWARVVERAPNPSLGTNNGIDRSGGAACTTNPQTSEGLHRNGGGVYGESRTLGFRPTCPCRDAGPPIPATVLDIFVGSGTTLLAANQLGRDGIGVDLKTSYVNIAEKRLSRVPMAMPLFAPASTASVEPDDAAASG